MFLLASDLNRLNRRMISTSKKISGEVFHIKGGGASEPHLPILHKFHGPMVDV